MKLLLFFLSIVRPVLAYYVHPNLPPGNYHTIQVNIYVQEDPKHPNIIQSVEFNGMDLDLKPADTTGSRGNVHTVVIPGKYQIRWIVNVSKTPFPTYVQHIKKVDLTFERYWVDITVSPDDIKIRE